MMTSTYWTAKSIAVPLPALALLTLMPVVEVLVTAEA
jgi:hypothetical protein